MNYLVKRKEHELIQKCSENESAYDSYKGFDQHIADKYNGNILFGKSENAIQSYLLSPVFHYKVVCIKYENDREKTDDLKADLKQRRKYLRAVESFNSVMIDVGSIRERGKNVEDHYDYRSGNQKGENDLFIFGDTLCNEFAEDLITHRFLLPS